MGKLEKLLDELPSEIFTLKDASRAGVSRYYISKLVEAEKVVELKKGVFQNSRKKVSDEDVQETAFKAASMQLKEKGVVCLWSALSYYDITEQIPSKLWFMVPYPYGVKFVKSIRVKNINLEVGVDKRDGFLITNIERTIIECFLNPKYVSVSEAFSSLKLALKEKKTNTQKIMKMAKLLKVENKIYPYIEIALT